MTEQHKMILQTIYPSGAEEWHCPTCGRRMTITWQPWKRIILEPGNIYAAHNGSKGGLLIGSIKVNNHNQKDEIGSLSEKSEKEPFTNDPYLAPWERWLDEVDYDDLWNKGN